MADRFNDDPNRPRPPRAEVEILPPGHSDPRHPDPRRHGAAPGDAQLWMSGHRLTFRAPGPLAMILGLIGLGLVAFAGFVVVLGLFLLWIPVLGALVAGVLLAALLRRR